MNKKVHDFQSFVRSETLNEKKFLSRMVSGAKNLTKKWISKFKEMYNAGKIPIISKGPNKGIPVIFCLDQQEGSLIDQFRIYTSKVYEARRTDIYPDELEKWGISSEDEQAIVPLENIKSPKQNLRGSEALKRKVKLSYNKSLIDVAHKPLFIFGAPGIGKTEIVVEAADEMDINLIFIDAQFLTPEDFSGLPKSVTIPGQEGKKIKTEQGGEMFIPPKSLTIMDLPGLLPTEFTTDGRGGIIFFDEFNRADPRTRSSLMNFVQSGRIGEYILPKNWYIIAAGNRVIDSPLVTPMSDSAEYSRFEAWNYVPTLEDYESYVDKGEAYFWQERDPNVRQQLKKQGKVEKVKMSEIVPRELISFLRSNKDFFHRMPYHADESSFPSPRDWTKVFRDFYNIAKLMGYQTWKDIPEDDMSAVLASYVGDEAAEKFLAFLQATKAIGNINELVGNILKGNGMKNPITGKTNPGKFPRKANGTNSVDASAIVDYVSGFVISSIVNDAKERGETWNLPEATIQGNKKSQTTMKMPNVEHCYYLLYYIKSHEGIPGTDLKTITALKEDFPVFDKHFDSWVGNDPELTKKWDNSDNKKIAEKARKLISEVSLNTARGV